MNVSVYVGGSLGATTESNQTWLYNFNPNNANLPINYSGWTQWTNPNHCTNIPARSNATMVFDANAGDQYGLLFGGYTGANYRADTWEFFANRLGISLISEFCTPWVQVTPGTAPSARAGYSMVYVPVHSGHGGYVLLFGGKGAGNQYQSDTWEYSGGSWTNITSTAGSPPSARSEAGIAYDSVDNYVVLFGGEGKNGPQNDTWEFNPATAQWSSLFSNGSTNRFAGPKGLFSPLMTMDSEDGAVILNGGATGGFATVASQVTLGWKQTWYFLGGNWVNISTIVLRNDVAAGTQTPLPTFGAEMVDATGAHTLLFQGGRNNLGLSNATQQFGTLLTTSIATNLGEMVENGAITVWANASRGAPPYTYSWTLPTGCTEGNVSTFTCNPSATGWQTFSVTVTDTLGASTGAVTTQVWIDATSSGAETLSISTSNPVQIPSTFWAFDWRCTPENNPSCVSFVKQTPVHWFRVAGSMEGYNATSGKEFSRFGGYANVNWNWPDIISLCQQVTPCNTVTTVPTQNNDTGWSVAVVNYVLDNYSFQPAYWSLGNEPQGWVYFNQEPSPTPLPQPYPRLNPSNAYQVGIVEKRIGSAVLADDPAGQLVIIQSAQCQNVTYNTQSALYAGQLGTAPVMACHAYPSGQGPISGQTAAGLLSPATITRTINSITGLRTGLHATCAYCSLPVWVTELNIANNGGTNQPWIGSWLDAAFLGTQFVQFAANSVPQMEWFNVACGSASNYALLTPSCGPTPVSQVYTNLFDHMAFQQAYTVTPSGGVGNIYAIEGKNGSQTSLFIVNANTTETATFSSLGLALGGLTSVYSGSPTPGWSVTQYPSTSSAPSSWSIPPLGFLMVNTGNASILYAGPQQTNRTANVTSIAPACAFGCQLIGAIESSRPPATVLVATVFMAIGGSLTIVTRYQRLFGALFVLGLIALII